MLRSTPEERRSQILCVFLHTASLMKFPSSLSVVLGQ